MSSASVPSNAVWKIEGQVRHQRHQGLIRKMRQEKFYSTCMCTHEPTEARQFSTLFFAEEADKIPTNSA